VPACCYDLIAAVEWG